MDERTRAHEDVVGAWLPRTLLGVVPGEMREALEGDLLEQIDQRRRTHGVDGARRWLVRELVRSMPAVLAARATRDRGPARALRWIACIGILCVHPLVPWLDGACPMLIATVSLAATPVAVAAFFTAGRTVTLVLLVPALLALGLGSQVWGPIDPGYGTLALHLLLISTPGLIASRRRRPSSADPTQFA